jgi:hypothetical protein
MFADGDALTVWLNGVSVNAFSPNVRIETGIDFLLRKRFRLFNAGVELCDYRYLYLDDGFPDEDIFSWIGRSLTTEESRLGTWQIWRGEVGADREQ